jgi:serine/threonine protein kinase
MDRLGQGGMASLYLARDPAIDRLVAIKVLREGFDTEELRERFAREARSAGRLRHANIVTVFDVGEWEGEPFIAMEYIAGETLAQLINRRAPIGLRRKLELLEELCSGLGYAHNAGVVHRDIKPANIMVDAEGTLKILDFGIARVGDSAMTQAGMLVGTLNYMSPEQILGQPVDHRSDIFAVGAVCYEFLTHRQAFPGNLQTGILHRILNADPEPIADLLPDLDSALAAIVGRALEKEPGNRYETLAAMRLELARLRGRLPEEDAAEEPETETIIVPPETPASASTPPASPAVAPSMPQSSSPGTGSTARSGGRPKPEAGVADTGPATPDPRLSGVPGRRDARSARRRQAADLIARAEGELERGELTAVSTSLERALELDPSAREDVEAVRASVERARRERERSAAIRRLLGQAREAFETGALDAAMRLSGEVLALDAGNSAAIEVQSRASVAIEQRRAEEEQRRREEEAARARDAVLGARERFDDGDHAGAIRLLESFSPRHDVVIQAIGELKEALAEIERRRAEEELRRREEEAARARDAVRAARERFDDGDHAGAIRLLESFSPRHDVVIQAVVELKAALAVIERRRAEEEEARRRAEAEREAREREMARFVAAARKALSRQRFDEGLARLDEAQALVGERPEIEELRAEVMAARAAEQAERERRVREAELARLVGAARKALSRERFDESLARLDEAQALVGEREDVAELRAEVMAASAAAEAERERRVRDAELARLVGAARKALSGERFDESLVRLDQAQALVGDRPEIEELRAEVMAASAAAEAARERRAREAELARLVGAAREALSGERFDESLAHLDEAGALVGERQDVAELRAEVLSARQAAEAARVRQQRVAAAVAAAKQAFDAGDLPGAGRHTQEALRLDSANHAAQEIAAAVERAEEAARRQAERDGQLVQAERHLASGELSSARQAIDRAFAVDATHGEVLRVRSAVASAEAEARRVAEERRRLERLLEKARAAARSPRRAIPLAEQALAVDPQNEEALNLLERMRAAQAESERLKAERPQRRVSTQTVAVALGAVLLIVALAGGVTRFGRTTGERAVDTPAASGGPSASLLSDPADGEAAREEDGAVATSERSDPPPEPASPAASAEVVEKAPAPAAAGTAVEPTVPSVTEQIAALRTRAQAQLRRGNRDQALESAVAALALGRDAATEKLLAGMVSEAQAGATKARAGASGAGAPNAAPDPYGRAVEAERRAGTLRTSGRLDQSVRAYWEAASLFAEAESSAVKAAAARAADAAPPPTETAASEKLADAKAVTPPVVPPPADPVTKPAVADPEPAAAESSPVSAEDQVRGVLDDYRQAYESLDAAAVRRVQPSLTDGQVEELRRAFEQYDAYRITITDIKLNLAGDKATVSCRVARRLDPKAGRSQSDTRPTVFHLEKRGGTSWVIARVDAR